MILDCVIKEFFPKLLLIDFCFENRTKIVLYFSISALYVEFQVNHPWRFGLLKFIRYFLSIVNVFICFNQLNQTFLFMNIFILY